MAEWTPSRVFKLYDRDNSGSLDISELEFALTSTLGYIVPLKEVEKLVKKYDKDGSGGLDLDEFTALAEDAKKGRSKFHNLFVYKSKSTKKMEKAHVNTEREKLRKLEISMTATESLHSSRNAANTTDVQSKSRLSLKITSNILSLIKHVETSGLSTEGIYRVSGSVPLVDSLSKNVLTDSHMTNITSKSNGDVHAVANAISRTLGNFAPVIPYSIARLILSQRVLTDDEEELKTIFDGKEGDFLEQEKDLLLKLLQHFETVVERSSENLMKVEALARTIGLRLLQDPDQETNPTDLLAEGERVKKRITVVEAIMKHWKFIFDVVDDNENEATNVDQAMEESRINIERLTDTTDGGDNGRDFAAKELPKIYADEHSMNIVEYDLENDTLLKDDNELKNATNRSAKDGIKEVGGDDNSEDCDGDIGDIVPESEKTLFVEEADETLPPPPTKESEEQAQTQTQKQGLTQTQEQPTVDQRSIKITWKKNSEDEPLSEEEIVSVMSPFGTISRTVLRPKKLAVVMFDSIQGVETAVENYNGPWKIKPMSIVEKKKEEDKKGDTEEASKLVNTADAKSIKVSWKNLPKPVPTIEEVKRNFARFGTVVNVTIKDDKYAIVAYNSSSAAESAVNKYKGVWKVKYSNKATASDINTERSSREGSIVSTNAEVYEQARSPTSKNNDLPELRTTPKQQQKFREAQEAEKEVDGDRGGDGERKEKNNTSNNLMIKTTTMNSPDKLNSDATIKAAQDILSKNKELLTAHDRHALKQREVKHNNIISNLITRLQETEAALQKNSQVVDELTAEKATWERRANLDKKRHGEEGRNWSTETMALRLQLKDSENAEKTLREELVETKKLLQQKNAELVSLQNTSNTIQVVRETAEARVKSEVGALISIQEKRLEAQSLELKTLSDCKSNFVKENNELLKQNKLVCEELVQWRTRAEASELELKSIGRLQVSEEEKKSLEFAKLLESKVVGIEAEDVPLRCDEEKERNIEGNNAEDGQTGSILDETVESRQAAALHNVVTSQDILEQAFSAQRALALRLDQDISFTERSMEASNMAFAEVDMKIRDLTGYQAPKAWSQVM